LQKNLAIDNKKYG